VTPARPPNPADFLDQLPDKRLLGDDMASLPEAERRPLPDVSRRGRRLIVSAGVALTAATLVAGIALLIAGVVDLFAHGFRGLDLVAFIAGGAFVATHWGWIHVAEATAQTIDARRLRAVEAGMAAWLEAVRPYTRFSVSTDVLEDGSIRITRRRHLPVRTGANTFSFASEPELEEVYSADEPGAVIAERAEVLRREAALDTLREEERWEHALESEEAAAFRARSEQERLAAQRAASEALSERVNRHLREPPLIE
jgi:hypothetical protein